MQWLVCWIVCQLRGWEFKSLPEQEFLLSSAPSTPIRNYAMMSTPTTHCWWEVDTLRERTGRPPTYAEIKNTKSLKFHTYSCLMTRGDSYCIKENLMMMMTMMMMIGLHGSAV